MGSHRNIFSIIVLFSFLISQNSFELLSSGGSKTNEQICQNPAWGLDSHTFTIEVFNDGYNEKVTSLHVGQIDDSYNILWKNGLTEDISSNKRKRGKSSKYYQRAIS